VVTEHTLSVLETRVADQIDLGSHTIFIGEALGSEALGDGQPMTYQYYHQTLKGKAPPTAPTFEPAK
jgi:ferric-chelate reductase [NAD(P)H]